MYVTYQPSLLTAQNKTSFKLKYYGFFLVKDLYNTLLKNNINFMFKQFYLLSLQKYGKRY